MDENGSIQGEPLVIWLDESASVEALVQLLCSGSRPFRFLGAPRWIEPDYAVIPSVDLHGGHRVWFLARLPIRLAVPSARICALLPYG